jgi:hypothetical protein
MDAVFFCLFAVMGCVLGTLLINNARRGAVSACIWPIHASAEARQQVDTVKCALLHPVMSATTNQSMTHGLWLS